MLILPINNSQIKNPTRIQYLLILALVFKNQPYYYLKYAPKIGTLPRIKNLL